MKFIKTRNVKSPVRDLTNAGIDCFVPELNEQFIKDLFDKNSHLKKCTTIEEVKSYQDAKRSFFYRDSIYIAPHEDIIIPSGLHSKFAPNLALIANNKSGIATKKKLVFGASVIDSNYQGEWHFHLINTSNEYQFVSCGDKIIQFIPHLISTDPVEVVNQTKEEFYKDEISSRGDGWAGSTGTR